MRLRIFDRLLPETDEPPYHREEGRSCLLNDIVVVAKAESPFFSGYLSRTAKNCWRNNQRSLEGLCVAEEARSVLRSELQLTPPAQSLRHEVHTTSRQQTSASMQPLTKHENNKARHSMHARTRICCIGAKHAFSIKRRRGQCLSNSRSFGHPDRQSEVQPRTF